MRWQGSGSGSTSPLQLTVNGELNVVGVFEKDYDPSYVNVSGYVEIQGSGSGTYFIPTNELAPQIFLAGMTTTSNELHYLKGLPGQIKSGEKIEFTPFKMYLNDKYEWIQLYVSMSELSNYNITSGEIVIVDKDTGKNISVKSTFYSTGNLGAFVCSMSVPKETPLTYETLKSNSIQSIEVRIIFKE